MSSEIKCPTDGAVEEAFPGLNQVGELILNPMEVGYGLSRKSYHMEEKIPRSVPSSVGQDKLSI